MKLANILALLTLILMVEGTMWLAPVLKPFVLTLGGTILGAIDSDVLDLQSIEWKQMLPFIYKKEKQKKKEKKAKWADVSDEDWERRAWTSVGPDSWKGVDLYEEKALTKR